MKNISESDASARHIVARSTISGVWLNLKLIVTRLPTSVLVDADSEYCGVIIVVTTSPSG